MAGMKKLKDMKLNGAKVSDMRVERGLTLEDLAGKLGVDTSTVSLWEAGDRNPGPARLKKLADFFGVPMRALVAGLAILAFCGSAAAAELMTKDELVAHMDPYFNEVVGAIYRAEGGPKARKPFGVLSVPCKGYEECREICYATVRNNYLRWVAAGRKGEYLEFLAAKYAPVGAGNDPRGLNKNWLGNVRSFLGLS